MEYPKIGSFWRHKKKESLYAVQEIANREATNKEHFPITVVYMDVQERVWALELSQFLKKMRPSLVYDWEK